MSDRMLHTRIAGVGLGLAIGLVSPRVAADDGPAAIIDPDAGVREGAEVRRERRRSPGKRATPLGSRARAVRRSGDVSIDGRLDEGAWNEAPASDGFVQRFPEE